MKTLTWDYFHHQLGEGEFCHLADRPTPIKEVLDYLGTTQVWVEDFNGRVFRVARASLMVVTA
jgi:hypothetical protein